MIMKDKKEIALIALAIIATVFLLSQKPKNETDIEKYNDPQEERLFSYEEIVAGCEENSGKWLEKDNECEYTNEDWCNIVRGKFMPCESACRHDPEALVCTMECVPVCSFSTPQNNSENTTTPKISLEEARDIALKGACVKEGGLRGGGFYNPNSKTWWIDMDIEKSGCYPACVIFEETGNSEINWRCTGLITD